MTYGEFNRQSNNMVYMTGAKAYLRTQTRLYPKVKMSEIDTIFSKVSDAIVIINEDQRERRVKQLNNIGIQVVNERHTGLNELSFFIKAN